MGNSATLAIDESQESAKTNDTSRASLDAEEPAACVNEAKLFEAAAEITAEEEIIDNTMLNKEDDNNDNSKNIVNNTTNGLAISGLTLATAAAAIISHHQAIAYQNLRSLTLLSTSFSNRNIKKKISNGYCKAFLITEDHTAKWLACGINLVVGDAFAQYSFPTTPYCLRDKDTTNLNNNAFTTKTTHDAFSEYKGQVEALQYCLPEDASVCVEILEQIERDLPRTFPERIEFKDERMRTLLRRVLIATAAAFPDVGYVQGQNFLAAFLLIHAKQDEDVAFCLLRMLMEHPKYEMHEMMIDGMPKVIKLAQLLEILVRKYYPNVQEHFDAIGLDTMLYSQNWIQTIFSYAMEFETLTFVWDLYFEDGWAGFLKVCLVLIGEIEFQLIKSDFETCVSLLRKTGSNPSFHAPERARSYRFSTEDETKITEATHVDDSKRNL